MRLQVIGENIKKIDEYTDGELLPKYPEIPWRKIIALRNIISHEYANVDEEIIFAVLESTLDYLISVRDNIVNPGKSNIKGIYLLWNMVDGREKSELYEV